MKVEIIPAKGINMEIGSISFGEEKESVISRFHDVVSKGESLYVYNKNIKIDFENNKVSYLEITGGMEGELEPLFVGEKNKVNIFGEKVKRVLEVLKESNDNRFSDDDGGYSYYFKKLGITVIREQNDDEIEELREELMECGIDPDSDEDFVYESSLAEHFCAIGLELCEQ